MIYLLNTFLGFLVIQISDILSRDKASTASPVKFNIGFFIKDTWKKIVLSLFLSFSLATIAYLNLDVVMAQFENELWTKILYIAIGAFPEIILQKLKDKFGFAQPEQVESKGEIYDRKQIVKR